MLRHRGTTGIDQCDISEAAVVKARWLGNFCLRQPVHRTTARSSASAHPGTVAYARAGPDGSRKPSRFGESEPCFCRDAR